MRGSGAQIVVACTQLLLPAVPEVPLVSALPVIDFFVSIMYARLFPPQQYFLHVRMREHSMVVRR
jgi:hypothetical protein